MNLKTIIRAENNSKKYPDTLKVDAVEANKTLSAKTAQDAWTDYCILRLRKGKSPGCDMRDFCAWWDINQALVNRV